MVLSGVIPICLAGHSDLELDILRKFILTLVEAEDNLAIGGSLNPTEKTGRWFTGE